MNNLALKYRPSDFSEVCSQRSVIRILEKQIQTNTIKNCYIFSGASGCGKTTIARIFSNKINRGLGQPIEIDGASNNGVDNVRMIIDNAIERSLDSEYKVFIIDECHMITTQGWNAFLKCIEEPPKYTIFIFCTTDPQKIPPTIINRCQVFNLSKVDLNSIKNRLIYICNQEHYTYTDESLEYISRIAEGSVRQAITYLDKCKDYSTNITINNVLDVLGSYSYDVMFELTDSIVDNNKIKIIDIIDQLDFDGGDLKVFIDMYLDFIIQLNKYCIMNMIETTTIPSMLEDKVKYSTGIENNVKYFNKLLDHILKIKITLKGDNDIKSTIKAMLISDWYKED